MQPMRQSAQILCGTFSGTPSPSSPLVRGSAPSALLRRCPQRGLREAGSHGSSRITDRGPRTRNRDSSLSPSEPPAARYAPGLYSRDRRIYPRLCLRHPIITVSHVERPIDGSQRFVNRAGRYCPRFEKVNPTLRMPPRQVTTESVM
jgi:hypothetical protein